MLFLTSDKNCDPPSALPRITRMLVAKPLIRKLGVRPETPNPDQDMLDQVEGDLHNVFNYLTSPESHNHVRKGLLGLMARARKILMESEGGVRVCKQLEWMFEWEEAGGPIGKPLEKLARSIDNLNDEEDQGGVYTRGKLFVNPIDVDAPAPPGSPLSNLTAFVPPSIHVRAHSSPLSDLTSLRPSSVGVRAHSSPLSDLTSLPPSAIDEPAPSSPLSDLTSLPPSSPSRSPSCLPAPKKKQTTRKVTGRGRMKQTAQRSTGGKAPLKNMTSAADDLVLPLQKPVLIPRRPRSLSLSAKTDDSNLVSAASALKFSIANYGYFSGV